MTTTNTHSLWYCVVEKERTTPELVFNNERLLANVSCLMLLLWEGTLGLVEGLHWRGSIVYCAVGYNKTGDPKRSPTSFLNGNMVPVHTERRIVRKIFCSAACTGSGEAKSINPKPTFST
jgi:hypothetical protein